MVKERELPFKTLNFLTRSELSPQKLKSCLESAEEEGYGGVSVCIRTDKGPDKRGGYLFHYQTEDDGIKILYFPFDKEHSKKIDSWTELHRFIVHVIGEGWDEEKWKLSQKIGTRVEEIKKRGLS